MDVLDHATVDAAIADTGWQREGDVLVRTLRCRSFTDAVEAIVAIAAEAERRNHHPDLCLEHYRQLTLRLSSHDAGGITRRDLDLVAALAPILDPER